MRRPLGTNPWGLTLVGGGWRSLALRKRVGVVAEERTVLGNDDHVAAFEEDVDIALGAVFGQPACGHDLPSAALGVAVGDAVVGAVGDCDIDKADSTLVVGDDVGLGAGRGLPIGC